MPRDPQRLIGMALATAMLTGLPAAAVAQDAEPTSPEGVDWTLTGYLDEAERGAGGRALRGGGLRFVSQDGIASGSGGCNQFSGSYTASTAARCDSARR